MKKLFSWMVGAVITFCTCAYLLNHLPGMKPAQTAWQPKPLVPTATEADEANKMVTVAGPLADYIQQQGKASDGNPQTAPWKPDASDLIVASPAGTGGVILHKTFTVATTAKFIFEIPAHTTNPQLRGTYRSFLHGAAAVPEDDSGNVEFLLMNEQQCADFLKGRRADVLFFVESSHSQQVNFELAPTYDRLARYCLVFRNRSGAGKKIVQADFGVDF